MDTNYTTKSQEAISGAMQAAAAAGNPQIEPAHLLVELLSQPDGVAAGLLAAVSPDAAARQAVGASARRILTQLPASSGSSMTQPQPSRALLAALEAAGEPERAAPLLREAARRDRRDEAVLAALMRAEAWVRSPATALEIYEDYRLRLREQGAVPGPAMRAAHEAALASESPVRRGLEPAPEHFLGREEDVTAVLKALSTRQLVTITGPGGVGQGTGGLDVVRHVPGAGPLDAVGDRGTGDVREVLLRLARGVDGRHDNEVGASQGRAETIGEGPGAGEQVRLEQH